MTSSPRKLLPILFAASLPLFVACGGGEETPGGTAGGGAGASGGGAGIGGAGGSVSGTGGAGGSAGAATGGGGGSAGTSTGGAAGTGTGGTAGATTGGAAGSSGAAGASSGGSAGAGAGGSAGSAGSAGTSSGGAGAGGSSGSSGSSGAGGGGGSGGGGAFTLSSPAFDAMAGCGPGAMATMCDTFPPENTARQGEDNVSPALSWTGAPANTMSFAVLLQDLSNMNAHWVIWNIPAATTMLPANVEKTPMPAIPMGAAQTSRNGNPGYAGPGSTCNVYEFIVYALSVPTFSPNQAADPTQVRMQLQALGASILGTASIRARQNVDEQCN
jgi:Raf kinase inhibitor-like YbhB/YbcL family protein